MPGGNQFDSWSPAATPPDPKLNFGKHKGEKLSKIPEDYLNWLVHGIKEGGGTTLIIGGRNWSQWAEQELARRKNGSPVESLSMETEGPEDKPFHMTASTPVSVAPPAIDDGSLLLLKEFVLRTNKADGFYTWLRDLAKEAGRNGKTTAGSGESERCFRYMGVEFIVQRNLNQASYSVVRIISLK